MLAFPGSSQNSVRTGELFKMLIKFVSQLISYKNLVNAEKLHLSRVHVAAPFYVSNVFMTSIILILVTHDLNVRVKI